VSPTDQYRVSRGLNHGVKTLLGGGFLTLFVLLFLAWLQPVGVQEERAVQPQFRFTVAADKVNKAPPQKQPQQDSKKTLIKREQSQSQKKSVIRKARPPRPSVAPRSSTLRAGVRSSFSGMTLMAGGGAGQFSLPVAQSFDAIASEAMEWLSYQEERKRIRELRGRSESDRSNQRRGLSRVARPVFLKEPSYPPVALQKQIVGFVRLRMLIDRSGKVEEAEILASQPTGIFDEAIKKVMGSWTFEPAKDATGKPIESWVEYKYVFKIEDAR
jgi:TonB family protein